MSTFNIGNTTPGFSTTTTFTPRHILAGDGALHLPSGRVIDGAKSRDPLNATVDVDVLRPGVLLGKITSGGKYAPSILGALTVAYTGVGTNGVSMTVSAATATEIARRIGTSGTFKLTGPPTAAGTVATTTFTFSAVDTSTGVITVTDQNVNAVAGSFIQPTDGSETPLVVLDEFVKVTDEDKVSLSSVRLSRALIGGVLDSSQVVNWPSDTSLQTWIKTSLNTYGLFVFDHDFGF